MTRRVVLVAAVADNGVIGRDGGVPWHLPGDLRHFRETTTGHILVMGRTTYDGIGRPLPHRTTIVLTRDRDWSADGVHVAHSLEDALALAGPETDVMVVGGRAVYEVAMPWATHQVLTEVHATPEGDTCYPTWDRSSWTEARREARDGYDLVWWERAATQPDGP